MTGQEDLQQKAIRTVLPKQYQTKDKPPLIGKDYNDFFVFPVGITADNP